jgi:hypothetical protein
MAKLTDKIIRKFKKVEKTYWDMTPEEKYTYVQSMLRGHSPNDEIRNQQK